MKRQTSITTDPHSHRQATAFAQITDVLQRLLLVQGEPLDNDLHVRVAQTDRAALKSIRDNLRPGMIDAEIVRMLIRRAAFDELKQAPGQRLLFEESDQ